jgi:hypothetical protein
MHTLRKLFLLAATVIAALALTATSALAEDEGVEVSQETSEGNVHCNPWCFIHANGASSLTAHIGPTEIVASACTDEFEGEVDENGEGHIDVYENNAATSGNCTRINCNGIGEDENEPIWPAHFEEEGGEETINVRFCLDAEADPDAEGAHCDVEIHVEDVGDHTWTFQAVDEPCPPDENGINAEVDGFWNLEHETIHDNIEIIH